jgi:preprotein translocase subunit SecG
MHAILISIHILLAIGLIGFVLLQHGRGADAGAAFGSGASATVFGARGSASFLSRATAVLAALFFLTSLGLAYLAITTVEQRSVTEQVEAMEAPPAAPAEEQAPTETEAPQVPVEEAPSDVPRVD